MPKRSPPEMSTASRILLVEDDVALVELLRWHLEQDDFEVQSTPSGETALRLVQEQSPDLILLDWMIEELSGLEVCRRLRNGGDYPNVPIIMLTARGEEVDRVKALETGADDYITKPFSPKELLARVRAVLRRVRPVLASERLRFADLEMDLASYRVRRGGQSVSIGPTEFRLLRHFMENPRRAFPRERLMHNVWGPSSDIDARTVDVHIRRLRLALASVEGPELIRTIRGVGYSLDDDLG